MDKDLLIQIVDDDKNLSDLLRRLLEKKGYRVVTAYDGAQGLKQLEQITPSLIVLDINMPRMNGLEFYKNILSVDDVPKFPVLVLTTRTEFTGLFKDVFAEGFIAKPFLIDVFDDEIAKIFRKADRPTVLLVDFSKSELVRNTVKKLVRENYKVIRIASAEEFRKIADTQKLNLILSEILPGEPSGEETLKFIKSYKPFKDVPVIGYCFSGDGKARLNDAQLAAVQFLESPARIDDFIMAVKSVVRGSKDPV